MYVCCDECGYDSGDRDSGQELADKVNSDGGHMEMTHDEFGEPAGWSIACPKGHDGESVHLD